MNGARMSTLASLRGSIERIEAPCDVHGLNKVALGHRSADAMLRVLEVKAAAGETSTEVTDLAMRVCGGAAFRKDVGVERHFRDARAATVMAPTTDVLYDFIGKVVCGLPLFG